MKKGKPAQVKSVNTLIARFSSNFRQKCHTGYGEREYLPACTYATAIETFFE